VCPPGFLGRIYLNFRGISNNMAAIGKAERRDAIPPLDQGIDHKIRYLPEAEPSLNAPNDPDLIRVRVIGRL
jgi:hypothetical protein